MRVIHYTSWEVNPWKGIQPGKNTLRSQMGYPPDWPGVWVVPDSQEYRHLWYQAPSRLVPRSREIMVILDVPEEAMLWYIEGFPTTRYKSSEAHHLASNIDNGLVIKTYLDPEWIKEVFFVSQREGWTIDGKPVLDETPIGPDWWDQF